MTTVAKMIEWLKTQPQEAEVKCGVEIQLIDRKFIKYLPVRFENCYLIEKPGQQVVEINGDDRDYFGWHA